MRKLLTICGAGFFIIFVGLACKNNPLAKFTKQYRCEMAGERKPQTSEQYLKTAAQYLADRNYSAEFKH